MSEIKGAVATMGRHGASYACPHCGRKTVGFLIENDETLTRDWLSKLTTAICFSTISSDPPGCGQQFTLVGDWVVQDQNAVGEGREKN